MEPLQIIEKLKARFPEDVISASEFRGQHSATVNKNRIVEICRYLHDEPGLEFDLLRDLTAVDYMNKQTPRFDVVYHIYSIKHRHFLRLKAGVDEKRCEIDSVMPVWIGANWHEREAYDLFGITFKGHPDLRRILLPEDWEGHPLRKDYKTEGPSEDREWPGYKEVVAKARRLKEYEWKG